MRYWLNIETGKVISSEASAWGRQWTEIDEDEYKEALNPLSPTNGGQKECTCEFLSLMGGEMWRRNEDCPIHSASRHSTEIVCPTCCGVGFTTDEQFNIKCFNCNETGIIDTKSQS